MRSFFRIKSKYGIVTGLLLGASMLFTALPVHAASVEVTVDPSDIVHNEQLLDEDTGEVIVEEDEESGLKTTVTLNSRLTYDKERQRYTYTFGDLASNSITSNIPNGMYTNSSVSLSLGATMFGVLYRNGQEDTTDLSSIISPGNYVLRLSSSGESDLGSFCFRITDEYTNTASYQIPEEFFIQSATRNGQAISFGDNRISMEEEGEYEIVIANYDVGLAYPYHAIVDHTPPTLKLEALNENNSAKSTVDISDLEPGVSLRVERNGEVVTVSDKLTTPGSYYLVLTDPAGNITTYQFVIYLYLTLTSGMAIGLLGGLFLALLIYLIVSRRHLRVR